MQTQRIQPPWTPTRKT